MALTPLHDRPFPTSGTIKMDGDINDKKHLD